MAISDTGSESPTATEGAFDPKHLVSRKPSALPEIYELAFDRGRVTPKDVRQGVAVTRSVAHSNLTTLCEASLLEKVDRGVYDTPSITLAPSCVHRLGEFRSRQQFEICRLASDTTDIDVPVLAEQSGMEPSNVRNAARRLETRDFLEVRRVPYEKSKARYRLSEEGKRALAGLDVERYLDRDGRTTVAHPTGIEGTPFRTAYEVEDADYLTDSREEWIHPKRVASALGKDAKQTQRRFAKMADRGLLERKADPRKLLFHPTAKATTLFENLELFAISRRFGLDFPAIARGDAVSGLFTTDELYSALVRNGDDVTVQELNRARTALKRAGLLEGDSITGYSFTIDQR